MDRTRKEYIEWIVSLPLLILDDLGMRKLPLSAAEDLLEIIMRRYERASTLVTSNIWSDWSGRVSGVASFLLAVSAVYYEWIAKQPKVGLWRAPRQTVSNSLASRPGRYTSAASEVSFGFDGGMLSVGLRLIKLSLARTV